MKILSPSFDPFRLLPHGALLQRALLRVEFERFSYLRFHVPYFFVFKYLLIAFKILNRTTISFMS